MPSLEKIKCYLGADPKTSVCGLLVISFVGVAFLMGRMDVNAFIGAAIGIAGGFGLLLAKDSNRSNDCQVPQPGAEKPKDV
jgi:hypothetical protein